MEKATEKITLSPAHVDQILHCLRTINDDVQSENRQEWVTEQVLKNTAAIYAVIQHLHETALARRTK